MKKDPNRNITNISYNYLGLPEEITLTNNRWIRYYYDGLGGKYKKVIHQDGLPDLEVHYQGDLIYHKKGNLPLGLYSLANDEGRVLYLNNDWVYEYQYKDHLGNLRVAFREKGGVAVAVQVNSFDPWGNSLVGINQEQGDTTDTNLYQGYEREYAFGLNLDDAVARFYDPQIGRMHGIDQVDHHSMSSYAAMGNNPVSMIDPDGRNPIAIGFMVSMFASSINHAINGTMPSGIGDFLRPGVTGAIGGYFSSFAPIGLLPGMGYGAATGAITGGIDAAMSGGDIGQGMLGGAIAGGVFGGVNSAIEADILGADILTGQRNIRYSVQGGFNSYFKEDRLSYSDETLRNFNAANFPDVEGVSNMSMKFRPKQLRTEGDFFINENGDKVVAATLPRVWKHGKSASIFFSKHAFYSPEAMFLTMGHELGHVQHILANVQGAFSEIERHIPIHLWEANAALTNGWSKYSNSIVRTFGLSMTQPDPQLNILTIPFKLNKKF